MVTLLTALAVGGLVDGDNPPANIEREGLGGAGVLDGEDDGNKVARCVGGVKRENEVDLDRIMGDGDGGSLR